MPNDNANIKNDDRLAGGGGVDRCEHIIARLRKMARECEHVTHNPRHVHATLIPNAISGFVHDELTEAADLIAALRLKVSVLEAAREHDSAQMTQMANEGAAPDCEITHEWTFACLRCGAMRPCYPTVPASVREWLDNTDSEYDTPSDAFVRGMLATEDDE